MVDKTEDKKEKDPFADSSEIFESIFKEATQEIRDGDRKGRCKTGFEAEAKTRSQTKAGSQAESADETGARTRTGNKSGTGAETEIRGKTKDPTSCVQAQAGTHPQTDYKNAGSE